MKNTFGSSVAVTLFGESHGPAVGAVLDGLDREKVLELLNKIDDYRRADFIKAVYRYYRVAPPLSGFVAVNGMGWRRRRAEEVFEVFTESPKKGSSQKEQWFRNFQMQTK